jgi:hypothetical protein
MLKFSFLPLAEHERLAPPLAYNKASDVLPHPFPSAKM